MKIHRRIFGEDAHDTPLLLGQIVAFNDGPKVGHRRFPRLQQRDS